MMSFMAVSCVLWYSDDCMQQSPAIVEELDFQMPGGDFWQIETFQFPLSLFFPHSAANVTDDTNDNITETYPEDEFVSAIQIEEMNIEWKNLRVDVPDSYYTFMDPIADMQNGRPCQHDMDKGGIMWAPDARDDEYAQNTYEAMLASSQMNKNTQSDDPQYYYYYDDGGVAWQLPVMFCIGVFAILVMIVIARRRRRRRALLRRRRARNAKASTVIAVHSPIVENSKEFVAGEHTSDDECNDYTMVMGIPLEEEKKEQEL